MHNFLTDFVSLHCIRTTSTLRTASPLFVMIISIRPEIRIAAYLMWVGGSTYSKTVYHIGIVTSTVRGIIAEVSRIICEL